MKFAYADPPYIGCSHLYADQPEFNGEIDHLELINRLCDEFPDGWALSCSSSSLKTILSMCPDDVRVMAWVKPFASFKPNVNPAYAWEPVIIRGGRKRTRDMPTVRDWVSCSITLQKGLIGAKHPKFCKWLFEILGAMPEDELIDLFPGTGIVSNEWMKFKTRARVQIKLTSEM